MSDVLARFEREYLEFHDISKTRGREVLRHLAALEQRAGVPLVEAPASALRTYMAELAADRKPTTMGKILGQIRPFFQWAWEAGLIDAQRLMEVRHVRPPRGAGGVSAPRPYKREEVKLLWRDWSLEYPLPSFRVRRDPEVKAVEATPEEVMERALWYVTRWENGTSPWKRVKPLAWRLQSRAIIVLALSGGLRRDEIHRLTVPQMHYDNAYIAVTGARKNPQAEAKTRAVPWTTPEMHDAVRDWLDLRARIVPGHDAAWLSLFSIKHIRTPLPFDTFEMLLTRMGRGWEFHRLRHTAATEMLRSGYPLETVKEVMGHTRIQQTLAYTQLLTEDVVKVAARCSMQLSTALSALEAA